MMTLLIIAIVYGLAVGLMLAWAQSKLMTALMILADAKETLRRAEDLTRQPADRMPSNVITFSRLTPDHQDGA